MSPRRLDPSVVHARLAMMRELLDDLSTVGDPPDLHADRMIRHGVERILTQLVELAASVNEHVVGAQLARVATEYLEVDLRRVEVAVPLARRVYRRYVEQSAAYVARLGDV